MNDGRPSMDTYDHLYPAHHLSYICPSWSIRKPRKITLALVCMWWTGVAMMRSNILVVYLLITLLILQHGCMICAHDVDKVEIDPHPQIPKSTSNQHGGDDSPKPLKPEDLSPEMIKNLKASIPDMKTAPGVDLPEGFDFQKILLEQLEKQEQQKMGGGGGGGAVTATGKSNGKAERSVKLTLAELAAYHGKDSLRPIYVSIRKRIYDVSDGKQYYGEGGELNYMAGKEVTRALATGCFESTGLTSDTRGLSDEQMGNINKWADYIKNRYRVAGWLKGVKIDESRPIPNDNCPEADRYLNKEPK